MVKKAKTGKVGKSVDNDNREAPGRPARAPGNLRSDRLVLRVHPDFIAVLSERAEEQRMTRSRFVEEILRGVLALDPRNPRFDMHGKIDTRASSAAQRQVHNPLQYLQQIAANTTLNASIFPQPGGYIQPRGYVPPDDE